MKLEISKTLFGQLSVAALASLGLVLFSGQTPARAAHPMPQIVASNGHHALFVDGAPFLMLGAQSHNSSPTFAFLRGIGCELELKRA